MKDNKGLSLVELVIVLAITTILGGAIFYSYTLIVGQYARECANNLSTSLEKEKNYALTRSASVDCYVEIVKNNKSYVARYYVPANAIATGLNGDGTIRTSDWVLADEQKIAKSRVSMVCSLDDGSEFTLDEDNSIKFIYNRTSGALKGIVTAVPEDDAETSTGLPAVINKSCNKITVQEGRKYEIQIFKATGKHVLSKVG